MSYKILNQFIVLEGLDGSGTTTQLGLFEKYFNEKKKGFYGTCEPTKQDLGLYIRKILMKEKKAQPETLARLFSADRYEHIYNEEYGIIAQINQNKTVVCDRYLFSSLAYQSLHSPFDTILKLNDSFPLPEHMIFIDTPIDVCQKRLSERDNIEIFDDKELQEKIRNNYFKAFDCFKDSAMNIHIIDGTQSIEKTFEHIISLL